MPSKNIKSKQLKKRVKNYRPTPAKFLWPELSFSIVYFKNMKKIKFLPKVQERPPFLTQILKLQSVGGGVPHARCALGSGATHF